MNIYLVRHGHPEFRNRGGNPALSELGHLQAQHLGAWMAEQSLDFAAFYSSDLQRALQTSQHLQAHLGLNYQPEPRLRESGGWAGEGFPYDLAENSSSFAPESWHDFSLRIHQFWEDLAAQHSGENILCVAHGGVFDVMMGQVLQAGASPRLVTLTHHSAFSQFHYDLATERPSRRLKLKQSNQIPHLGKSLWHTA